MKIKLFVLTLVLIAGSAITIWLMPDKDDHRKIEEERSKRNEKKAEAIEARDRYDFDMITDPATGKVPKGIFDLERAIAKAIPEKGRINNPAARGAGVALLNSYLPAGPNNVGGRTRALAYDVRFGSGNNVIISGCVSGGIMRSEN